MSCQSSALHLLLATWASLRVTACLLGCATCQPHSRGNAELPWGLNLCLIYLDDIIIFSQMAEEHLHHLCIVFDQYRDHTLKLKPTKCNFFRNEITYLAHQVSTDGVCPSNSNLKAITECTPPQTYKEVCTFLGLVGHYRRFIKGFTCIAQPLSEYLAREGASRKSEQVSLTEDAMKALEALKQACMTAPILVFADYTKPFLLETDASKDGLGAVLSWKQTGNNTWLPMAAEPWCLMRKTITPPNLSFWH